MTPPFKIDMAEATRLTRLGRLNEAMAVLTKGAAPVPASERPADADSIIDMTPPSDQTGDAWTARAAPPPERRFTLDGLMTQLKDALPTAASGLNGLKPVPTVPIPDGAAFETHMFANAAGQRPYKLYVPAGQKVRKLPLIVMLHGCTQSPDDFAAGTRMNELAEAYGFLVAYPGQTQAANTSKCWNWFNTDDQQRERGEPAIIAGLTREIIRAHAVDPARVYAAGLSAGGAIAAIMGAAYPDLYAAVGVHSGLACGAARDMPSAFNAMSKGATAAVRPNARLVPTIVFHGDADKTVHSVNGEQVLTQARGQSRLDTRVETGISPGGMRYTRTNEVDDTGRNVFEQWTLHGAGHAWAGGSPAGSYTDPRGPDASREMVRFFLTHS